MYECFNYDKVLIANLFFLCPYYKLLKYIYYCTNEDCASGNEKISIFISQILD